MKFVPSLLAASICSAVFAASAAVPVVTDTIAKNAELMNADPAMQALLKEATSEEAQKWRFNTLLELARIASPSRFEMRRQAEITRRLVEEWGFAPEDIMTRADGFLKGAGVQTVDGKPVCERLRAHSPAPTAPVPTPSPTRGSSRRSSLKATWTDREPGRPAAGRNPVRSRRAPGSRATRSSRRARNSRRSPLKSASTRTAR